jgi:tetratricopeptide (TPR) repeat protein
MLGKSQVKYYLLLFFASFLLYSNTLNNGFVLDDDVVFLQNTYVQKGVEGIPDILSHGFLYGYNKKNDQSYRPIVLINFAIEKSLFGNNPRALHFFNVLYYALLCCLLFHFLSTLVREQKPWLLFWISLLFALHPIHTEVVANIKGRDDILHALFLLLTFVFALKYVDKGEKKALFLALSTYLLALLCKEIAVTFIALLPISIWFFREKNWKEIIRVTSYFGAVLLCYFLLRNSILDTITFEEKMRLINNGIAAADTYWERLATTLLIFANYIKLLFFPHPLSWDYSYPHFPIVSLRHPLVIITLLSTVSLIIIALLKTKAKNIYAYCLFFFLISFSIVSNFFVLIGATLGERFLFFPSIAFCLFIGLLLNDLSKSLKKQNKSILLASLFTCIALLYSFKTFERNKDWKSNETLFIAGAEATPNNTRAISALATVYRERGERATQQQEQIKNYQLAIKYYLQSIALYEENINSLYNLGVVYMNTGQNEEAKIAFKKAIAVDPNYMNALNNLGVLYFREQNYTEAEKVFLRCLAINPNMPNALANLGAVYHNLGDHLQAKQYYEKALQLNPNDANTRANLSKLQPNL